MKKIVVALCVSLCAVLCFSSCAKDTYSDSMPTGSEKVLEIIIPDSLLQISGQTQSDFIQSFNAEEDADIYTDIKLADNTVVLLLTENQKNTLLTRIDKNIDKLLEEFYNFNSSYKAEINQNYTSLDIFYDEKIPQSIEAQAVGGVVAEEAFAYVLTNNDPDWNIHLKIYNCHTNKLVAEGDVAY